jgi:hypothetical protein
MTDAPMAAGGGSDVRRAAEALKRAVDSHLAAVEARSGESDPVVQDAYTALHDAAQRYDDLLFEVHDEVTPFVFSETTRTLDLVDDEEYEVEPEWVSMLARWDFAVDDREALMDAGRTAAHEPWMHDGEEQSGEEQSMEAADLGDAFGQLVDAYGHDVLVDRAEEFGLTRKGATTWLVAAAPTEGEEWMDDPFTDVDEDKLIYRIDEIFTAGLEESEDGDDTAR